MLNYMLLCPAAFCGEARCAGAVSAFDALLNKGIRRRKQLIGFLLGFLTAAMQNELLRRGEVAQNGVMRKEVIIL